MSSAATCNSGGVKQPNVPQCKSDGAITPSAPPCDSSGVPRPSAPPCNLNGVIQISVAKQCQHCEIQTEKWRSYNGKRYKFLLDNGIQLMEDGSYCHMHGLLDALLPFGEIPHQDLEAVPAEGMAAREWCKSIGFVDVGSKLWTRMVHNCTEYLTSLLCAGVPLQAAQLSTITMHVVFAFDDILDNFKFQERNAPFPYKHLLEDIEYFLRYLLMDESTLETVSSIEQEHGLALQNRKSFVLAMCKIRQLAFNYEVDPTHFLNSLAEYFRFCGLESYEMFHMPGGLEYAYTKHICQGLHTTLEMIFLVNQLQPSVQLRNDPRFALFSHLTGVHVGLVNDLLSFKKELKLGETKNYVRVLAKSKQHTFQTAFDSVVEQCNEIAQRLLELKEYLLLDFSGDHQESETTRKCLQVGLNYANSHFYFYIQSERYLVNDIYFQFES